MDYATNDYDFLTFCNLPYPKQKLILGYLPVSLLHKLIECKYWKNIELDIFNQIYKLEHYKDYTIKLLEDEYIKERQLTSFQIKYLSTTIWG